MKNYFILFILTLLIYSNGESSIFAAGSETPLRPSITNQMKKNAIIAKRIIRNQKIEATKALEDQKKQEKLLLLAKLKAKKTQKSGTISGLPIQKTSEQILPTIPPKINIIESKNNIVTGNTQETIQNVDISRVRSTWIGWYNTTRAELGLNPYSYDTRLDISAHEWNTVFSEGKGQNHHRRNPANSYYDFPVIDKWFSDRGINPKVINKTKHVENVGYGYYKCTNSDCTDTLINSIRSTYDFFMSEKGKSYDAHYKSIIQPNFTRIGMSIIVNPNEYRYYITIHYITE